VIFAAGNLAVHMGTQAHAPAAWRAWQDHARKRTLLR
jgi:hypothetical protein